MMKPVSVSVIVAFFCGSHNASPSVYVRKWL
jgi:hypothetical protein